MSKPCAYLAGPGVFRPNAREHGDALKGLCAEHGLIGLYPLDPGPDPKQGSDLAVVRASAHIFAANCAKIDRADVVIADLSPFRGLNADDGTAWEIGYAFAREKPIFAYSADLRPLIERIPTRYHTLGRRFDPTDMEIEDFGLPVNLMLAISVKGIYATDEEAIAAAAKWLAGRTG